MPTTQELIKQTHARGIRVLAQIAAKTRLEKALRALNARRRKSLLPPPPVEKAPFTMYDSVTVSAIPTDAVAVAGYVGGKFATFPSLVVRFPKAKRLSIAVTAEQDATCLDVEIGDARPDQAPAWIRRQQRLGKPRPVIYANLSTMPSVKDALAWSGIKRSEVRLWVAHYTGIPHLPAGFDACQYTDRALGVNLDASLCKGDFLP